MSSRDIRDILSLPSPLAPGQAPPARVRAERPKLKRPEGITRELYALIGDNAPSLALAQQQSTVKPKFKERIKRVQVNTTPVSKWLWTAFTNPAREGVEGAKLVLNHWVKNLPAAHQAGDPDSKFVQYNTSSQPYRYTEEEYEQLLKEEDWSKDETDQLFLLARHYDLRFLVMADRWDIPTPRTVDDMKARYYSVCRKLIRARPTPDEPTRQSLLQNLNFDKPRELERKSYLRSLLSRTSAQIAEEDFLYLESRRLEQSYAKITREREDILKILGGREGIGASGGMQVGGVGGRLGALVGGDKKKRGGTGEGEGVDGRGLPDGWAGEGSKRKATPAQDIINCIERHQPPSSTGPKPLPHPSLSLRSSRVLPPKPSLLLKVSTALEELKISSKLIMPTKINVEKFDELQSAVGSLIELKRAVDRLEAEVRMMRKRKAGLLGLPEEDEEVKMEIETEGEGGLKRSAGALEVEEGTSLHKKARID